MADGASWAGWLVFGALTLLPLAFVASTSFVKVSFVFSILRNALGTGPVPSGLVITTLAIVLSAYVMAPVASAVVSASAASASRIDWERPLSPPSVAALRETWTLGVEPVRRFLHRNSSASARQLFVELGVRAGGVQPPGEADLRVVLPAFLITELEEAFQIGFVVFLPFLVVDLFVANTLLALGMGMLAPSTVSLPFKLLLFVLVDGWYVLSQALVTGYG
jgi:type III secretion protein R